jgi:hypothetical protein
MEGISLGHRQECLCHIMGSAGARAAVRCSVFGFRSHPRSRSRGELECVEIALWGAAYRDDYPGVSLLLLKISSCQSFEVHIVCQASYHRANFYEAFSSLPFSLLGISCAPGGGMDRLFEQTGGIGPDRTALRGSLECERSLNLQA